MMIPVAILALIAVMIIAFTLAKVFHNLDDIAEAVLLVGQSVTIVVAVIIVAVIVAVILVVMAFMMLLSSSMMVIARLAAWVLIGGHDLNWHTWGSSTEAPTWPRHTKVGTISIRIGVRHILRRWWWGDCNIQTTL